MRGRKRRRSEAEPIRHSVAPSSLEPAKLWAELRCLGRHQGPAWILDVTALVIPGSPPTLAAFPEKTQRGQQIFIHSNRTSNKSYFTNIHGKQMGNPEVNKFVKL